MLDGSLLQATSDVLFLAHLQPDEALPENLSSSVFGARGMYEVLGVLVWHRRNEPYIRAVGIERRDLLAALIIRHDDHRSMAERAADHRQTDACVACRAFDDHAAGSQRPAPFGLHDP